MYQLGIIFICPSYCLLFKKYFPLNTKNCFKYLEIILYLTLTVAPNSDISHCSPKIISNTNDIIFDIDGDTQFRYFPLKTKYYFKYLGMILYLTLTVAPNSEMGCFTLALLGSNIPSLNWPAPVSPNYFWKPKEIIM